MEEGAQARAARDPCGAARDAPPVRVGVSLVACRTVACVAERVRTLDREPRVGDGVRCGGVRSPRPVWRGWA